MTADGMPDGLRLTLTVVLLVLVGLGAVPILSTAFQFLMVPLHAFRNHYRRAAPYLPRVAVIIPAWNEENVIAATIERLLHLDYPPERVRILVVDDASTDRTPQIVQAKAAEHGASVVHLRRAVGGEGKAHTLNHGIERALADDWMQALLIIDADVIFQPDALRRMTRHLADDRVGAVTAYVREGSGDKNYLTRSIGFEYVLAQLVGRRAQNVLHALACLAGGAQLHSRRNLEAIGGRIDASTLAEDTVTTFETQLHGRLAVFEPYAVVLAEEPQTVAALWKQRLRWARGNLQVTRRYRRLWFRPDRDRHLGSFSFGLQWFSILVLPLVMVLAPIGFVGLLFLDESLSYLVFRSTWIGASCLYVFTVAFGLQMDGGIARSSWRQAIAFPGVISVVVMISAFDPALFAKVLPHAVGLRVTTDERLAWTLFVYLWISLSMVVAWLARDIEGTRVGRHLTPFLIYLVGYGPLLCAVAVDAYVKEFRKADARWEKTEKIGRVPG